MLEACSFLLKKPFEKNNFIHINNYRTYFSESQVNDKKSYVVFDHDLFFDSIKFLINNSFITFGGKIFHQKIGIPMGQNYSPLLADLFLFFCEYKYLSNLTDKYLSCCFNNITRYIDDVAVINLSNFDHYLPNIYPPELEITKSDD